MVLAIPVDVEQLVVQYLLGVDDVVDLVGEEIYTELPKVKTFPIVRVWRIPSAPIGSRPLHLDRALLQIDTWADRKKQAHTAAATIRAALADMTFVGVHDLGVVTGVEFGAFGALPDDDFEPAKQRYRGDVAVFAHPLYTTVS